LALAAESRNDHSANATVAEFADKELQHVSMTSTYIYQIVSLPSEIERIQRQHLEHITEVTKDLAPIQGEELTYEQQQWMRRKLRLGFTKPVRDQLTERERQSSRGGKISR